MYSDVAFICRANEKIMALEFHANLFDSQYNEGLSLIF